MIVILLLRGGEIEIRKSDLAGMAGRQVVEHLADDGVVVHLELMTVFEDEGRWGLRRFGSCVGGLGSVGRLVSRSVGGRRNVGIWAGAAAVEDGWSTLVVGVVVIVVIVSGAYIDGVGHGQCVNIGVVGGTVGGVVRAMFIAVAVGTVREMRSIRGVRETRSRSCKASVPGRYASGRRYADGGGRRHSHGGGRGSAAGVSGAGRRAADLGEAGGDEERKQERCAQRKRGWNRASRGAIHDIMILQRVRHGAPPKRDCLPS